MEVAKGRQGVYQATNEHDQPRQQVPDGRLISLFPSNSCNDEQA